MNTSEKILTWNLFKESGFLRSDYREDPPIGSWPARIDLLVYAKGNASGIHVFLTAQESSIKYWTFCRWLGGENPVYLLIQKHFTIGDRCEFTFDAHHKSGIPLLTAIRKREDTV